MSDKRQSMYENTEPWDANVPVDFIPAIKHLRKSFADAHWGCGRTTQKFCYAILHNEALDDPANEYVNYLMHIKVRVGDAATDRFRNLVKQGTPSAIFKGFYDLYLEGLSVQVLLGFKEFMEIGHANETRLGMPHLEWAEAQTKHLIRSFTHRIGIWVKDVCDKQLYDPNEDSDERLFWRKWQAPMFLVMKPSRFKPYDAATVWQRNDAETSSQWLDSFAEHYVLHLEANLKRSAGEAALALAKQAKPMQTNTREGESKPEDLPTPVAMPPQQSGTQTAGTNRYMSTNTRREARKLDTRQVHGGWKKEYRRLLKTRPDMSGVWYSEQIAKSGVAKGRSAETIRKHMKP